MIIKILILVALIKMLLITHKPLLCAELYIIVPFVFSMIYGEPFLYVIIGCIISFVLAYAYFWLLNKFEGQGIYWWIILIVGLLIGLV